MTTRRIRHPTRRNPLLDYLGSLLVFIMEIAISLPLYIPLLIMLPTVSTLRWLLFKFHVKKNPGCEAMGWMETRWMMDIGRSVMHAVLVLDTCKGLSMDQLRRILLTRVLPLYPRLTRLPIPLPLTAGAGYCWIPDAQFAISKHILYGPTTISSKKDVESYLSRLMRQDIQGGKPPWEFHIIPPRESQKDTMLIVRVHQSIGDGSELLRVLCHSLADKPLTSMLPETPHCARFSFILNALRSCITGPCTLLSWLWLMSADSNALKTRCKWNKNVTVRWTSAININKVMRIKQVTRSSVNCVILSALAGATRVIFQRCGVTQPPNIKVLVPINISSTKRKGTYPLRNNSTSMIVPLSVSVEGCVPRLWATRRSLASLGRCKDPVVMYMTTAALMTLMPAATTCHILHLLANKTTLQYSSITGPTTYLEIAGGRLKELYSLAPAIGDIGLSVSCVTYANQVQLSVTAEKSLEPAGKLLLAQIIDQVETLWKLLLNRRVPGENLTSYNISWMPEADNAEYTLQQVEDRILEVQKQIAGLHATRSDSGAVEYERLKLEYARLVNELKRRKSDSSDVGMINTTITSLASRLSGFSLKNAASESSRRSSYTWTQLDNVGQENGKHLRENVKNFKQINRKVTTDNFKRLSESQRKNSFEMMRIEMNQREIISFQNKSDATKQCSLDLDGGNNRKENDVAGYSAEENTDNDYENVPAEPINSVLKDLYCTNYLEHQLKLLNKQKELLLSQE